LERLFDVRLIQNQALISPILLQGSGRDRREESHGMGCASEPLGMLQWHSSVVLSLEGQPHDQVLVLADPVPVAFLLDHE